MRRSGCWVRTPPLLVVQVPSDRLRIARSPETIDRLMRARALAAHVTVAPGADATVRVEPVSIR
jgi:hypothetical protein